MKKSTSIATGKIQTAALLTLTASMGWGGLVAQTRANPAGGQVVAGNASTHHAGSVTTVTQHSPRAIINWQDFSIGQGETVRFVQPGANSAVLNRVVSLSKSSLDGQLHANGKVYLINPNGIVVGPTGRIDAGSFIASTLDVSNEQFLRGGDLTFSGSSTAAVINRGTINGLGGDVFMIARTVDNAGSINAAGTVGLAAGSDVLLTQAGSERLSVRATAADGQVLNAGQIAAAQAELKAANGNIYALAINNTGVVRATTVQRTGGRIILKAAGGEVANRGTLDASGEIGGSVTVTGTRVGLYDGSQIAASGHAGGGQVYVGGGKQGQDPYIANAQATYVAAGAAVHADATVAGPGGTVIVWGDESARVYGRLSARGGTAGGDGGFVETSGKWIDLGRTPDVSAVNGRAGQWLIDPDDLRIVAGNGLVNATASPFTTTDTSAEIGVDLILAALNGGGAVTVSTANSGNGQLGDITLDVEIDFTGIGTGATLTLDAHNDIILNQRIYTSGNDSLNLVLNADADGDGNGIIVVAPGANLNTNGGDVHFNAPTYLGARFVNTGNGYGGPAGDIVFDGDLIIADPMGAEIDATGAGAHANVVFNGTVNSGNAYTLVDDMTRNFYDALAHARSGDGDQVGDTYLATVTSELENSVVRATARGSWHWLAATDDGQEGVWRWIAGPEGLTNGGQGEIFDGPGAAPGAYTNWNAGEPNNHNGLEHYLHGGWTIAALWNDVSASSLFNYVKETNQAPLPLTVYGKDITFRGAVGNHKPVSNFVIDNTGTLTLETDSITATGFASFAALGGATHVAAGYNPVIRAGGNITINQDFHTNAADTTVQFHAGETIQANSMSFNGTARQNLTFAADADDDEYGGIKFYQVAILTHGGDVLLGGGSNPATGRAFGAAGSNGRGVFLNQTLIDTDGGNITLRGQGAESVADAIGVDLVNSTVRAGGGDILIDGTGGAGTGDLHIGVSIFNNSVVETGNGGDITITGAGGGDGYLEAGINIESNSTVRQTDGNGTISLDGVGGANAAGLFGHGIFVRSGSSVYSLGGGAVSLTGNAAAGYSGIYTADDSTLGHASFTGPISLVSDSGLSLGGTIRTTGTGGDVTLNADRDASGSGGIYLRTGMSITTDGGDVVLGGGANPLTTAAYGETDGVGGVVLDEASISAGAGNIFIRGQGYNGTNNNRGVDLSPNGKASSLETTSGNITIVGVAAGSGVNNSGVNINYGSTVQATSGDISITGASSGGLSNIGVVLDRSLVQVGSGDIQITGTGGSSDSYGITGLHDARVIATDGGSISLVGVAAHIWDGFGIYFGGNGRIGGNNTGDVTIETDSIDFDGSDVEVTGRGDLTIQPHTPGTDMTLGTWDYDSMYLEGRVLDAINSNAFDRIILGRDTGRGTLDASSLTSTRATTVLRGTDITLGIVYVLGDLVLDATGSVDQKLSPLLMVSGLLLRGTGSFELTGDYNFVTMFASEATGAVSLKSGPDLMIDAMDGVNGVSGASSVTIVVDGELTLNRSVAVTGGGNSVVLAADTLVNNVGAGAINPGAGRFLIYTLDPADNTRNGLAAGNLWDRTYAANAPGTITQTGNQMIYALAPTLMVTADDKTKDYGASMPGLTYTITGFLEGDTQTVITGSAELTTVVNAASNVGSYGISAAAGTLTSDTGYQFTFADGTFTVSRADLTIRANNASRAYGAANPAFTATYEGLVNGDTAADISGLVLATPATATSTPGTYPIHASGATSNNYDITMVDGVLTVTQAHLTIRANNLSMFAGGAVPRLTASIEGLPDGDTADVVQGLTLTTAATPKSRPGTYAIHVSGASADHYTITMVDGVLSVLKAPAPTDILYNETARGDLAKGGAAIEYAPFGAVERTSVASNRRRPPVPDTAEQVLPLGGMIVTFRTPADAWTIRGQATGFTGVLAAAGSFNLEPASGDDRRPDDDDTAVTSTHD